MILCVVFMICLYGVNNDVFVGFFFICYVGNCVILMVCVMVILYCICDV